MPEFDGIWYATHREVYEPSDDSFLLAKVVEKEVAPGCKFLEVGCGTGIVSLFAARAGAKVIATDRNPFAVVLAKENGKQNGFTITTIQTDLLASINEQFDVIAFNPPYLPTAPEEVIEGPLDMAFNGGLDGNEVVLEFAKQVSHLESKPKVILVIHSSLSDPAALTNFLENLGYATSVAAYEKHFMEELRVLRFELAQTAPNK